MCLVTTVFPIRFHTLDPRLPFSKLTIEPKLAALSARIRAFAAPLSSETADSTSSVGGLSAAEVHQIQSLKLKLEQLDSRDKDGGVFIQLSFIPPSLPKDVEDDATTPSPSPWMSSSAKDDAKAADEQIKAIESFVVEQLDKAVKDQKPWWVRRIVILCMGSYVMRRYLWGENKVHLVKVCQTGRLTTKIFAHDCDLGRVNPGWKTWM